MLPLLLELVNVLIGPRLVPVFELMNVEPELILFPLEKVETVPKLLLLLKLLPELLLTNGFLLLLFMVLLNEENPEDPKFEEVDDIKLGCFTNGGGALSKLPKLLLDVMVVIVLLIGGLITGPELKVFLIGGSEFTEEKKLLLIGSAVGEP